MLQPTPEPTTVSAFRRTLRELGYIEGKNIVIETRYAEGRLERLPGLFAELVKQRADVIVTGSLAAALEAKKASAAVPVVFAGVLDASASGLVPNLGRPGGNITGATYGVGGAEIAAKWIELLKEAAPRISHVAVLASPADPQAAGQWGSIQAAATTLKVKVSRFDATDDATLERAFGAIPASGAHGLIVTNSPYYAANRFKLVQFAAGARLPAVYYFNLFPDVGGLMSYGGSIEDSYRRAAVYVDKILKGAKAGELPVDQATKFELVVNLKAAKALGLKLPPPLLVRADRVIQ